MLKMDIQGSEREAIAGAYETLDQVDVIECELTLRELYAGQTLLADMVVGFREAGFELCALQEAFKDPVCGETLQMDGLFVRTTGRQTPPRLKGVSARGNSSSAEPTGGA